MYIVINGRKAVRSDVAAEMLDISVRHVHNLLADELLEFEKVGSRRWIFVDTIEALKVARDERKAARRYGFSL